MFRQNIALSGLVALAACSSFAARTGTLSVASVPEKERTFLVSFANHAHETNGLWVVYGTADQGATTNGWDHAAFVTTVRPETDSVEFAMPAEWDAAAMPVRFLLSEVPYAYDYTLSFLRSGAEFEDQFGTCVLERIALTDFDFKLSYRIRLGVNIIALNNDSPAILRTSDGGAGGSAPTFGLLPLSRSNWRFDYNDTTGTQVSGVKTKTDYDIDLSFKDGLIVNGEPVDSLNPAAQYSTASSKGKLVLFQGSQGKTSANNNAILMKMYGVRIYDEDEVLRVNLVPMVKDGEPGFYDTVRNAFYFGDMTNGGSRHPFHLTFKDGDNPVRIESENPFFAATPAVDAGDHVAAGGSLDGKTLKLTGQNDWGGEYTVRNSGALVAAFGQGLGANDHLVLTEFGAYAGWNGEANAPFGGMLPGEPAAGTVYTKTDSDYLCYTAADGDLTVNAGGQDPATPIVFGSTVRRLFLNGVGSQGRLDLLNPIWLLDGSAPNIFRMRYGTSVVSGNVTGLAASGGATLRCYGEDIGADAILWMNGPANALMTLQVYDGRYGFGGGSQTELGGNFHVYNGEAVISNATVTMSLAAGMPGFVYIQSETEGAYAGGSRTGGKLSVLSGGELTAYGFEIGRDEETDSGTAQAEISGKVTLKINPNGPDFTSLYINRAAASAALTLNDGAEVTVPKNLVFRRRNVYHRGGTLTLNGGAGVTQMGRDGTSRYTLSGGTLTTPAIDAAGLTEGAGVAQFIFDGGRVVTSSEALEGFFQFNPSNGSYVRVTGRGGEFTTTKDVSILMPLTSGGDWTATPAEYLTAPAFRKSGVTKLTLKVGAATYKCATEVAAGTLQLTTGDNGATLPTDNVVRLTGGTLDLGGNDQTLKALLGTAGAVRNGSVTATEGVYPGGAGTIGAFTCDAALAGTLTIDVDASGAADSLATTAGLDLSNLDLVINAPATAPAIPRRLKVVTGPLTGTFKSVSGLPDGWTLHYVDSGVSIGPDRGMSIILR